MASGTESTARGRKSAATPKAAPPVPPEVIDDEDDELDSASPSSRMTARHERVDTPVDAEHVSLLQRAELPRAGVPAQYDDGVEWLVSGLRRVSWGSFLGVILGWTGAWLSLWGAVGGLLVGAFVGLGVAGNSSISQHLFNLGLGSSVTFVGVLAGASIGALLGFLVVIKFVFLDNPLQAVVVFILGSIVTSVIVLVTACFERASLRIRGYRRLSNDEVRKVAPLVKDVADAMGLPALPRFAMDDTVIPNAFTHMRTIVLTKGLLQSLDDGEIRAILAHELNHWRSGDSVALHFVWAASLPAVLMYKFGVWCQGGIPLGGKIGNSGRQLLTIIGWFIAWPSWILIRLVLVPVIRHSQRRAEYAADAAAADIGLSSQMISALTKISAFESGRTGWEETLNATHPPTELRIEALQPPRPDDWEYQEEELKPPDWPEVRRIFGGIRRLPRG
jgi:Zn-dependent protease with chaperone function